MDLLESLEQLRLRLNNSGVERTTGLRKEMGDDCRYYRKSKELFLQKDYEEIRNLLYSALDQIELVEGPNGRKR